MLERLEGQAKEFGLDFIDNREPLIIFTLTQNMVAPAQKDTGEN